MANSSFEDYVVRSMVETVTYDTEHNEVHVLNLKLNDSLYQSILNQAALRGISIKDAQSIIQRVAQGVNAKAESKLEQINVNVDSIKSGSHIILHFKDITFGPLHIELMSAGLFDNIWCGYVLSSNIQGLNHGDILLCGANITWNHGFDVEFQLTRDGKRIPSDSQTLIIPQFTAIETFMPSYIHHVLDTDIRKKNGMNNNKSILSIPEMFEMVKLVASENRPSISSINELLVLGVEAGLSTYQLSVLLTRARASYEQIKSNQSLYLSKQAPINVFTHSFQQPLVRIVEKTNDFTNPSKVKVETINIVTHKWSRKTQILISILIVTSGLFLIATLWMIKLIYDFPQARYYYFGT